MCWCHPDYQSFEILTFKIGRSLKYFQPCRNFYTTVFRDFNLFFFRHIQISKKRYIKTPMDWSAPLLIFIYARPESSDPGAFFFFFFQSVNFDVMKKGQNVISNNKQKKTSGITVAMCNGTETDIFYFKNGPDSIRRKRQYTYLKVACKENGARQLI